MVNSISSSAEQQQIGMFIQEALGLLDGDKKKDSETVEKRLLDLLIQYILANMVLGSDGPKAIMDQIGQLLIEYGKDIQLGDTVEGKLKLMETNEGANPSIDLNYLQNLIGALRQDATSGDLSNLSQFQIVA